MLERVSFLIERYGLSPLPGEGGFFSFNGEFGSGAGSILYLITEDSFSTLHMLRSDELWFFLEGDPAVQLTGSEGDGFSETVLSSENRFALVKAGLWQATRLEKGGTFALFSTVMSPRYVAEDYLAPSPSLFERNPFLKEFCHA